MPHLLECQQNQIIDRGRERRVPSERQRSHGRAKTQMRVRHNDNGNNSATGESLSETIGCPAPLVLHPPVHNMISAPSFLFHSNRPPASPYLPIHPLLPSQYSHHPILTPPSRIVHSHSPCEREVLHGPPYGSPSVSFLASWQALSVLPRGFLLSTAARMAAAAAHLPVGNDSTVTVHCCDNTALLAS